MIAHIIVGQKVEWLFEARGGYGYRWWVPAVVVKVGAAKVTINALKADGTTKRISVSPESLRPVKGS